MSKVSPSADSHSTDVCRFRFDAATSTLGSNDPIGTYRGVSARLGSLGMSQVSRLVFLRCFVTDPLNLGLYRCDLDVATLTAGSMDSVSTFWKVSGWLRNVAMSQVSCFDFLCCFDLYSFDFESSASMAPSSGSVRTICGIGGWPRRHM